MKLLLKFWLFYQENQIGNIVYKTAAICSCLNVMIWLQKLLTQYTIFFYSWYSLCNMQSYFESSPIAGLDGIYKSGHEDEPVFLPCFCYQMIAKPGNKTSSPLWPDRYTSNERYACQEFVNTWTIYFSFPCLLMFSTYSPILGDVIIVLCHTLPFLILYFLFLNLACFSNH